MNGFYYDANVISALIIMLIAILDRYVIRNGSVKLLEVKAAQPTAEYARFELAYKSTQRFIKSELVYTVRNKEDPTTVIHGKTGSLDFSHKGLNREFLLIDKKLLNEGEWVVNVKVTTTGSRINPLHKIFPIETKIQREVDLIL